MKKDRDSRKKRKKLKILIKKELLKINMMKD